MKSNITEQACWVLILSSTFLTAHIKLGGVWVAYSKLSYSVNNEQACYVFSVFLTAFSAYSSFTSKWRNWRCDRGSNRPPGKLTVKTEHPLSLYFGFSILLFFNRLLFFCIFRSIFGFNIRIHHHFANCFSSICFFWVLALQWPVSPLQQSFPPWLKPVVTALLNFLLSKNFSWQVSTWKWNSDMWHVKSIKNKCA